MKSIYLFVILNILASVLLASSKKVLLIGIDGCRPDVLKIAKIAGVDDFVSQNPAGYDLKLKDQNNSSNNKFQYEDFKSTYNNISDKFELSKSEEMLKDNLVENLVTEIINSASNFLQSSKINDN